MTDQATQYVVVQNGQPKKTMRYYYDSDDDYDDEPQMPVITRRIVRTQPTKGQRIRYVTTNELESNHRRPRLTESIDVCIYIQSFSYILFVSPLYL